MPTAGAQGNEFHVGAYCTKGGDQCSAYLNMQGAAIICAIDADPEGGAFCIKIGCMTNDQCGAKACCTGRIGDSTYACVPLGCLDNDSGVCPAVPHADASVGD
jgi:hypothetical protein